MCTTEVIGEGQPFGEWWQRPFAFAELGRAAQMGDSDGIVAAVAIIAAIAIGGTIAANLLKVTCPYCGAVFTRGLGPTATCPNCTTNFQVG